MVDRLPVHCLLNSHIHRQWLSYKRLHCVIAFQIDYIAYMDSLGYQARRLSILMASVALSMCSLVNLALAHFVNSSTV